MAKMTPRRERAELDTLTETDEGIRVRDPRPFGYYVYHFGTGGAFVCHRPRNRPGVQHVTPLFVRPE